MFHENTSSESRVLPCGGTDGDSNMTWPALCNLVLVGTRDKIFLWNSRLPLWCQGDTSPLQVVKTGFRAHHPPMGTGVLFQEKSGRVMKLTTHLHIIPTLRMSGAIPLISLYALMAWSGKTHFNSARNFFFFFFAVPVCKTYLATRNTCFGLPQSCFAVMDTSKQNALWVS